MNVAASLRHPRVFAFPSALRAPGTILETCDTARTDAAFENKLLAATG